MKRIELTLSHEAYAFASVAADLLGYRSPEEYLAMMLELDMREEMRAGMVYPQPCPCCLRPMEEAYFREVDDEPEVYEDEGGGLWPYSCRPQDDEDDDDEN